MAGYIMDPVAMTIKFGDGPAAAMTISFPTLRYAQRVVAPIDESCNDLLTQNDITGHASCTLVHSISLPRKRPTQTIPKAPAGSPGGARLDGAGGRSSLATGSGSAGTRELPAVKRRERQKKKGVWAFGQRRRLYVMPSIEDSQSRRRWPKSCAPTLVKDGH